MHIPLWVYFSNLKYIGNQTLKDRKPIRKRQSVRWWQDVLISSRFSWRCILKLWQGKFLLRLFMFWYDQIHGQMYSIISQRYFISLHVLYLILKVDGLEALWLTLPIICISCLYVLHVKTIRNLRYTAYMDYLISLQNSVVTLGELDMHTVHYLKFNLSSSWSSSLLHWEMAHAWAWYAHYSLFEV